MPGASKARKQRKQRSYAAKRALDAGGIAHGFKEGVGTYGQGRDATTFCGIHVWEMGAGFDPGWKIVPVRPITCLRCLAARVK